MTVTKSIIFFDVAAPRGIMKVIVLYTHAITNIPQTASYMYEYY